MRTGGFLAMCVLWCVLMDSQAAAGTYVYVSAAGEKRIATWEMNEETGALTHRHDIILSGEPGALCHDPARRFLFAAYRSTGDLASFRIDAATGRLTLLSVVPSGPDPAFVSTDRSGKYLLSAFYVAGKVESHRILDDGRLEKTPACSIATDKNAHAILTDPSNRFAYVPHTGPNAIYQFRFDERTGELSPLDPPLVRTAEGTGPRHAAFHPRAPIVYFNNEQGCSVSAFVMDVETGLLTHKQTWPTLPEGVEGPVSNARLEMSPSGRFLYSANRGHQSLAGFAVDAKTGLLTPLGQTPTEKTPRSFSIEPGERFLFAAGQDADKLAAFRIDAESGQLERVATYEVGRRPWWVHTLRTPE